MKEQKSKLVFKKFQISKIEKPQVIFGGSGLDDDDDDGFPTDSQRPGQQ